MEAILTVDRYRPEGANVVSPVDGGGGPTAVGNGGGEWFCGVLEVLKRLVKVNNVDVVRTVKSD